MLTRLPPPRSQGEPRVPAAAAITTATATRPGFLREAAAPSLPPSQPRSPPPPPSVPQRAPPAAQPLPFYRGAGAPDATAAAAPQPLRCLHMAAARPPPAHLSAPRRRGPRSARPRAAHSRSAAAPGGGGAGRPPEARRLRSHLCAQPPPQHRRCPHFYRPVRVREDAGSPVLGGSPAAGGEG